MIDDLAPDDCAVLVKVQNSDGRRRGEEAAILPGKECAPAWLVRDIMGDRFDEITVCGGVMNTADKGPVGLASRFEPEDTSRFVNPEGSWLAGRGDFVVS